MLDNTTENLDLRIQRTRRMLLEAIFELLQEKDANQLTVQEITDRAMVNRATFYAHYTDKQDLLNHAMQEWFQRALDEKDLGGQGGLCEENLRRLIEVTCTFLVNMRGHCAPTQRAEPPGIERQVQVRLNSLLLGWLEQGARQDDLPPLISPEIAASTMSWAIYGTASSYARHSDEFPPARLAEQIEPLVSAMLRALMPEQAAL